MMTSATKSEEKRRDWSVQRGVDHNKIRVNQAVETRNRAQFLGQVPKQQRKSYRRLARGTKHRQHARKGILLGECRLSRHWDLLARYGGRESTGKFCVVLLGGVVLHCERAQVSIMDCRKRCQIAVGVAQLQQSLLLFEATICRC